ncbi:MAG: hypothetical protein Gaeavirus5_19 [Gaeavirus sp.]|uniref:Uncharacterized protein n=1 Tax=Gaeavirus sp. TaxID=2487767 RepID=A0A3G4ZYQ9_9VIRU|nr:MAG: hypothetical protein Gaeavirus5_19 [Gaeavirus sp.]
MSSVHLSSDTSITFFSGNYLIDITSYPPPLTIINDISPTPITIFILYQDQITTSNQYLIAGSSYINFQGPSTPIIGSSVSNFAGLISNPSYSNVNVSDIHISAAFGQTPTLAEFQGWICAINFGLGGTSNVTNCSSSIPITSLNCGGIIGSGSSVNATNCTSSGAISGNFSGGIFGANCFNSTASFCSSTGLINDGSGGIYGGYCNYTKTNATCSATSCFSMGDIGASNSYNCGGIFGGLCNPSVENCTCVAINCFSMGNIYGDGSGANGGIFGGGCQSTCSATNCYSVGVIGTSSGGIFGPTTVGSATAANCYSIGAIGSLAGGIFGESCTTCTAQNCYSAGSPIGEQGGGIFGYSNIGSNANNCYSVGLVSENAGGIFGANATTSSTNNCYMIGGNLLGGFYNQSNYEIFGPNQTDCSTTNCFSDNPHINLWNTYNASTALLSYINRTQIWISASTQTPFLLASFNSTLNSSNGLLVNMQAPTGYIYYYLLTGTSTTTNGNFTNSVLSGYYLEEQQNPTTASAPYSSNIFGYNIISFGFGVNVYTFVPVLVKNRKNKY